MQSLIFATGNDSKLGQIRFIVENLGYDVEIVNGRETYGELADYQEVGESVFDIARRGAMEVAQKIGKPVIAEDTDFCVEVLGGEPGIKAGRYLLKHGRQGILDKLKGKQNRQAVIHAAVAYAEPTGDDPKVFTHELHGTVAKKEAYGDYPSWISPAGDPPLGGGYNAIFIPNGYDKTLAEISPQQALPWSYRERNFIDLLDYVTDNIGI